MSVPELLECILSIRESAQAQTQALSSLEELVADLLTGRETDRIAAWQQSQQQFDSNVASILLQLIARNVAQLEIRGQVDSVGCHLLSKALSVLQGLLFLHHNTARLFERRGMLEILLVVLKAQPASLHGPSAHAHDELIHQTLSALLAILVDRPRNAQVFEQIGGLADIADLLRAKSISKSIRYACLELLFFYLAPEEEKVEEPRLAKPAMHPHRHSIAVPLRTATPPNNEDMLKEAPQTPAKKRPWSARPSIAAETEQAPSTPRGMSRRDSERSTPRHDTPLASSRPAMIGTPLVKSPSTPEQMSEALAEVPTGSSSTPNTPERPRTGRHQSSRLSSIMALPPRMPLSVAASVPQLLASTPARARSSLGGKPTFESSALRKSSLSPGQSRGSHLAFSTPSPSSPRKRDSFAISRDITPIMSKSRPASAVSPSKRASIGGAPRAPLGQRSESLLSEVGEEVFSTMVIR